MDAVKRNRKFWTGGELVTYLRQSKEHFYIYGTGEVARKFWTVLIYDIKVNVDGVLVTEPENNPKTFQGGYVLVYAATDEKIPRDKLVIIATGSNLHEEIMNHLEANGYQNYIALTDKYTSNLLKPKKADPIATLRNQTKQMIWRSIPHPFLNYIAVRVLHSCNLNCAGCSTFAPLAEKDSFISLEVLKEDIGRAGALLKDRLRILSLMGGETLLHPHLTSIMKTARTAFPDTFIYVQTNGLLLKDKEAAFWEACLENDIAVMVTKYPISLNYDELAQMARIHGVKFLYHSSTATVEKSFGRFPLDVSGSQNAAMNFINCKHVRRCNTLYKGRLYPCSTAADVHLFSEKFKVNIPMTEADGVDIYQNNTEGLLEKLSHPMPICRFCALSRQTSNHKWETSRQAMEEWT